MKNIAMLLILLATFHGNTATKNRSIYYSPDIEILVTPGGEIIFHSIHLGILNELGIYGYIDGSTKSITYREFADRVIINPASFTSVNMVEGLDENTPQIIEFESTYSVIYLILIITPEMAEEISRTIKREFY